MSLVLMKTIIIYAHLRIEMRLKTQLFKLYMDPQKSLNFLFISYLLFFILI